MMKQLRRLSDNREGNFGIMTAILTPVLIGVCGFAVDAALMMWTRADLQAALDSAALAGSSALLDKKTSPAEAKKIAADSINSAVLTKGRFSELDVQVKDLSTRSKPGQFEVRVSGTYEVELSGLQLVYGGPNVSPVSAMAVANASISVQTPASLFFVIDKSDSMNYGSELKTSLKVCSYKWDPCPTKMDALKLAASNLFNNFDTLDPSRRLIRIGGNSYDDVKRPGVDIAWGTDTIRKYINNLSASFTTNSAEAFAEAVKFVTADKENREHHSKSGLDAKKYIIFMTDGQNNNSSIDDKTKKSCDDAKTRGVTVTTIAFMAPPGGQELLRYCASSDDWYFAADNAKELDEAFRQIGDKTRISNLVTK